MKTVVYYYDGYEDNQIWFDEAVSGLKRYYNSYGIHVSNLSYKNSLAIKNFINKVGRNWNSMMTSRVLYLSDFLKTDYDMMIVTDLDYVILRADIDINQYLNSDFIVPHCCYFNHTNGNQHVYNKMKFYDSINPGDYCKFLQGSRFVHMSCDYFIMSRKCCEHMVEYYNLNGWEINDWENFADKYLDHDISIMIDEGFYGCYLNHLNNHPMQNLKTNCEYKDGRSRICSTTWGDYKIEVKNLCDEEQIFHHFGYISKRPEEMLRLLKLFKKG